MAQDFQAFTVKFSGKTDVLTSSVGVSIAFNPNTSQENLPKITEISAIWDTGASCTVISKEVANQLNLVPTGKITITGVNHTSEENTYFVNIYLPNKVMLMYVKIVEAPALSGGAGMLVGMDIIGSGDFSVYNEDGKTVMSYRFPTIGGMDFAQEAGNIRNQRAIIQTIEKERGNRKPLTEKEKLKRRQEKLNRKKSKKRGRN